jgi:hypothetical protein
MRAKSLYTSNGPKIAFQEINLRDPSNYSVQAATDPLPGPRFRVSVRLVGHPDTMRLGCSVQIARYPPEGNRIQLHRIGP